MKIAIIGSGISGLTAASMLHKQHDITVYEKNNYVGGHANTHTFENNGKLVAIDTGFIVFNDWTYPNFEKLISNLDIKINKSNMGFSVYCQRTRFEWSGENLKSLLFNKSNWHQTKAYHILFDFFNFNKIAKEFITTDENLSLGEFLQQYKFSQNFIDYYILPMGSAIWSTIPEQIMQFPATSFLKFFNNHGLLNFKKRPQWKTIQGGSKQYVQALIKPFANKIKLNTKIIKIKRTDISNIVITENEQAEQYDMLLFACHSDQVLKLLEEPNEKERSILGAIKYQNNTAVLHTDKNLMPKRRTTWSAWNYSIPNYTNDKVTVTYHMNQLQKLNTTQDYFVTLNQDNCIDKSKIITTKNYAHPVFNQAAIKAQARYSEINGFNRTYFCGAYWRNGFHEDGAWSAVRAVNAINETIKNEELYLQRAS